jgi:hypothetical protein
MLKTFGFRLALAAGLTLTASGAMATALQLSAPNGLYRIWSATFDGGVLNPCGGGSSTYCAFFGGDPTASQNVQITPNPSTLVNNVPGGIGPAGTPVAPVPASGSFLDLTLSAGNTVLTLGDQIAATGDSAVTYGPANICVAPGNGCAAINANIVDAGMVFNPTGPVNGGALTPGGGGSTGNSVTETSAGSRLFVFQVQNAGGVVVDFSRFSQVYTSCTGAFCAAITADGLNLDMIRYVLEIQYDPTYTTFTGKFIGQTTNSSLVFANLNSVPVPAAVWLMGSALGLLGWIRRRAAA